MSFATSLEGYWWLDEESGTRYDQTANDNDLGDNNTVLYTTGVIGNCADFELDNDEFLSIADNASLSFGNEHLAIACWVRLETKASGMGIVTKWDANAPMKEYALLYASGATDRFQFVVSDDDAGTNQTAVTDSVLGEPDLATWYFIVAYHDPDNDVIGIQINNGTADEAAYTHGINDSSEPFRIGAHVASGPAVRGWDGEIDEVGVWRRQLTSTEKTKLYSSGAGCRLVFPAAGASASSGAIGALKSRITPAAAASASSAAIGALKHVISGVYASAVSSAAFLQVRISRRLTAMWRNYFLRAPQHFDISSSKAQLTARHHDYSLTAPQREENMTQSKDLWLEEIWLVEGTLTTPTFTTTFQWATTVAASPTIEIYKDGNSTNVETTYMPSGSHSVSGNTLTWKALGALVPGKYVIVTYATVDGVPDAWKCKANVVKKEEM